MSTVARQVALVALASVLTLASATTALARRDDGCIGCHELLPETNLRTPADAEEGDVHGRAGISCTSCHFGDPDATTARAHDLAGGFRGIPDALGTVQVCGRCHDGSRDDTAEVLGAYRHGAHGTALAMHEPGAASCTDCHGAHGIEPATNPSALTSRANVVDTCSRCHADAEWMEPSGLRTDVERQWRESVHGRAFAEGNEDVPTCVSCHGAHQNGAGIEASQACTECHETVREAFDRGPHATEFTRLGFLDCAECHGNHAVRPVDGSLLAGLGAACSRCHGAGQEVFVRVERLAAQAARIDAARAAWDREDPRRVAVVAAVHSLDVEALEAALHDAPAPSEEASRPTTTPAPAVREGAPRSPLRRAVPLAAAGAVVLAIIATVLAVRRRRAP